MTIIKTERIKLSETERKALDLVSIVVRNIHTEITDPDIVEIVEIIEKNINELELYIA